MRRETMNGTDVMIFAGYFTFCMAAMSSDMIAQNKMGAWRTQLALNNPKEMDHVAFVKAYDLLPMFSYVLPLILTTCLTTEYAKKHAILVFFGILGMTQFFVNLLIPNGVNWDMLNVAQKAAANINVTDVGKLSLTVTRALSNYFEGQLPGSDVPMLVLLGVSVACWVGALLLCCSRRSAEEDVISPRSGLPLLRGLVVQPEALQNGDNAPVQQQPVGYASIEAAV